MRRRNSPPYWSFLALALLGGLLAGTPRALAAPAGHPAPSVLHDYIVTLTPHQLGVQSFLRISPELVPDVFRQIDTDGDGRTADAERAAWSHAHVEQLGVSLDGVAQHLQTSPLPALSREDLLVSINHPIGVFYTVALTGTLQGKHRIQLTYGDNYLSYDEYYVSVNGDLTSDGKPHGIGSAHYPATYAIVYHIPDATNNAAGHGQLAPAPWTAPLTPTTTTAAPATSALAEPSAAPSPPLASGPAPGPLAPLLDTLRAWHGDLWAALGMLLLVLGLGALHALSPGHGKAMVAAYLVGSQGRPRDAVLLGGVVTITHTFGVFALGLVLLLVSNISHTRALQPALELLSGVLVVGLGGYLLLTRGRALWHESHPAAEPAHSPRAGALSPVGVAAGGSVAGLPVRRGAGPPAPADPRAVPHRLPSAPAAVPEGMPAGHDAGESHAAPPSAPLQVHSHGGRPHIHLAPGARPSRRMLLGLGISGGLVPCPDAIAILLLAVAVGQIGLGLVLVSAFSVGLAAVLIGLGLALVTMRGALARSGAARLATNPLWTSWVPLLSAALVLLVGLLLVTTALTAPWG